MKKHLLAAAVVGALAAGSANALTSSQSYEHGPGFTFVTTNWTQALTMLTQFNPLLGTLNSVMLTVDGEMNQNIKAENTGASPDLLTPNASGSVSFRQGSTTILNAALTNSGGAFAATGFDGTSDFAGTSGKDFGIINAMNSNMTTLLAPLDLAGFIGVGDLSAYNLRGVGGGAVDSDNGNLDTSITTEARGRITVKYDYTERNDVPEPGSMLLVGLGLLGLGAARRLKA